MTKRRFFIVKRKEDSIKQEVEDSYEKKDTFLFPYEKTANELMKDKGFIEYVKKHGYHFNKKLAEYVSKSLYDNALSFISEAQISETAENSKMLIGKKATMGDIIYASNLAHSTFPELFKDVKSCVVYANKIANSTNAYEGIIFCRWTADIIGKNLKINWEKFI